MGKKQARAARPEARVGEILQGYADKAVFRGFSAAGPVYRILWHRNQLLELRLDTRRKALTFPALLPEVPASIYRELQRFLRVRTTKEVPEHRRIDPRRARLQCVRRKGGNVSLAITSRDGDYDYATRKLIHLVHEVFLLFLSDHFDYQVEAFDLDPDQG